MSWLAAAGTVWLVSIAVHAESGHRSPAQDASPRSTELPAGDGSDIARARCVSCHGAELIVQQRLSRAGWTREVDKMIGWGAVVDDAQKGRLLEYLAAQFGESPAAGVPVDTSGAGAALIEARCLACHDSRLIDQQRLGAAGWTREVEKMIGWGAVVSDVEKAALVEHLASARPAR